MNKKCCIVIPVYKNKLNRFECESLTQCVNVFKEKYNIYLVHPKSLDVTNYYDIVNYVFYDEDFVDSYFKSKETYSSLCTSTVFYNKFKQYDYMLLYQLDGWVFYDNLEYFIKLGYDWYGSPWVINNEEGVGNGGVSLRKIKTCLNICKKYGKSTFYEDQYFCIKHADELNICTLKTALKFGLCANSHNKYFNDKTKCPMFAHQINNPNHYEYWQKHIIYSDNSTLEDKKCVKFNNDSKDFAEYSNDIYKILANIKR